MTRIIAGRAGSLRLEVPKAGTRPTSDRVREAIFSALESWGVVASARVVDLYAGSGALGLEAASRGASSVTLVEKHPQAAQVAGRNAKTVLQAWRGQGPDIAPSVKVERQSVQAFLDRELARGSGAHWDVALIDPPYDLDEESLTANLTALVPLLAPEAVVLVERSSRSPEPTLPAGLAPIRNRAYGETVLWWSEPV
ncbi:16S rRNA (guanine966-N2)-methyltransferase [Leucobacter komagatae]|uniref:16S rRNA (Guanine966-N2)-methyltransferase n=1 Tax=Leucobacter komagatae TaxID=55969 RepID=A0A542Y428_9MICO|nr:RsmD family RNA methyltransferase [Leucobacter komagatae]TQL42837.1 16S rRNA (guanine966-N2)-methyltransferase [Leucobacter komagatae]